MPPKDPLDKLIELLCTSSTAPLEARLKRAGLTEGQVAELCARPDASGQIFRAAAYRYLLPAIPGIMRQLATKASGGSVDAQAKVLALLSDKGGLREQLGMDMGSASDASLQSLAVQLVAQLGGFIADKPETPCR